MVEENKKPLTPEKELLRLIEKENQSKQTGEQTVEKVAVKHTRLSFFAPGAWIGRISFLKEKFKKLWGSSFSKNYLERFSIKLLNRALIIFIFALFAYFMYDLTESLKNLNKMPELELKGREALKETIYHESSFLKSNISYYLEQMGDRNIFKMGPEIEVTKDKTAPSIKIVEAVKNLKLVGISWSDNPDVMVEDKKAKRTFFLKRGQMIGDIKIEAIFKDKVIVSYEGEELELK